MTRVWNNNCEMARCLETWLHTPYFETKQEWKAWVTQFRPRVVDVLKEHAECVVEMASVSTLNTDGDLYLDKPEGHKMWCGRCLRMQPTGRKRYCMACSRNIYESEAGGERVNDKPYVGGDGETEVTL